MYSFQEQFVVDKTGNQTAVLLNIRDYRELLAAMEELESIKAYDEAKKSGDESIPFTQAIADIENSRI